MTESHERPTNTVHSKPSARRVDITRHLLGRTCCATALLWASSPLCAIPLLRDYRQRSPRLSRCRWSISRPDLISSALPHLERLWRYSGALHPSRGDSASFCFALCSRPVRSLFIQRGLARPAALDLARASGGKLRGTVLSVGQRPLWRTRRPDIRLRGGRVDGSCNILSGRDRTHCRDRGCCSPRLVDLCIY